MSQRHSIPLQVAFSFGLVQYTVDCWDRNTETGAGSFSILIVAAPTGELCDIDRNQTQSIEWFGVLLTKVNKVWLCSKSK